MRQLTFVRIFLFLETVGLLDWRALYAIQYNIIQYDTTQHKTIQYSALYNVLSLEFELAWGENCSKDRKIHAKVDSRIYGRWAPDLSDGNSMNVEESTYFLHQCLVGFFLCLYTIFFLFLTKKNGVVPPSTFCVSLHLKFHFMRVLTQGRALNRETTLFLSSKSLYVLVKVGN